MGGVQGEVVWEIERMQPILVFDFDGTLYRGDRPFRIWAEAMAKSMSVAAQTAFLNHVERFLDGDMPIPFVQGDNWEAMVSIAEPYVEDHASWEKAFWDARHYMLAHPQSVEVPDALRDFLRWARGRATLVLASNSPELALWPLLQGLCLKDAFHRIVPSAGKPAGLTQVPGEEGTANPGRCLSIGDNYRNDIAPAVKAGWRTAHISPRGIFPGPATWKGRTVEEVLPAVVGWLHEAGSP